MFEIAIDLLNELNNIGYEAYIIGGYPRDMLLGIESNDIDITTNAHPDIIKNNFLVVKDNSKYGSLIIKYKDNLFEITTFRIETEYKGRYPEIIYTNSLEEDLKRRDFTINTICIDKNKKIIDLMNGKCDLNNKIVKSIGDSDKKLKEDPIRILRAIRLCGKLDFKLDEELKKSIINNVDLIETLTNNQTNKELQKMNKKSMEILKELNINI